MKISRAHHFLNLVTILALALLLFLKVMADTKADNSKNSLPQSKLSLSENSNLQKSPSLTEAEFEKKLDPVGQTLAGNLNLAIYDVSRQETYSYKKGDEASNYMASTVKLSVLTELLLEKNSDGSDFDSDLTANVQAMIRDSDNDATNNIIFSYLADNPDPIQTLFDRFGMKDSVSGINGDGWGLSKTTPEDQLILLKNIFLSSKILTPAQQNYIKNEMQNVTESEQWGVRTFTPTLKTYALKNGWGISDDNNMDVVNSIGVAVTQDGKGYLIAAYGSGFTDDSEGIASLEKLISSSGAILTAK